MQADMWPRCSKAFQQQQWQLSGSCSFFAKQPHLLNLTNPRGIALQATRASFAQRASCKGWRLSAPQVTPSSRRQQLLGSGRNVLQAVPAAAPAELAEQLAPAAAWRLQVQAELSAVPPSMLAGLVAIDLVLGGLQWRLSDVRHDQVYKVRHLPTLRVGGARAAGVQGEGRHRSCGRQRCQQHRAPVPPPGRGRRHSTLVALSLKGCHHTH